MAAQPRRRRRSKFFSRRSDPDAGTRLPLSPRRLEPRRMLDAAAPALALDLASLSSDYVQAGPDAAALSQSDDLSAADIPAAGSANTPPSNIQIGPLAPINENEVATLELTFDDPDPLDTHTVEVKWGDGTTEVFNVPAGSQFFGTTHQYLDDDPSVTSFDIYNVDVTVTDSEGESAVASAPIRVNNVAPSNLQIGPLAPVNENGVASLELTFDDPGSLDTHQVEVKWGDGSTELFNVPLGSRFFGTTHQYLDDDPSNTSFDVYTVNVRVLDDDGGEIAGSAPITVSNIPPATLQIDPIAGIDENGVATLKLSFDDPGTLDTHKVEVDWGDGSAVQLLAVPAGARTFTTNHQYLDDNPSVTSSDTYTVKVRVLDDDLGQVSGSQTVLVKNVAPSNLQIDPLAAIDENGFALLHLTFDDPGSLDSHKAEIDWGDGSALEIVPVAAAARSLFASHQYLDDNPTGTAFDSYTIKVRLLDDDSGEISASTSVTVNNVPPSQVAIVPTNPTTQEGTSLGLSVTFNDPGPLDTHTYQVDWGDGLTSSGVAVGHSFPTSHTYADNGVYSVKVQVTDDDTGVGMATTSVNVANVKPTLAVVGNQSINEGALLSLTNIGSFTDPGFNNPLNVLDPANGGETTETFTYSINWGDGTASDFGSATVDVLGSPSVLTAGSFDGSHIYADNGVYTVTVTVFDDDSGSDQKSFQVTVANVSPTLTVVPNQSVNEGTLLSLTNIGTFTDPGFDNLLNAGNVSNGGETVETFTYTINWGDGTATDSGPATVDVPGSPGVLAAGSFDGSHTYADNGVYTVTVTVFDDDLGSNQKTFQVTVANVSPTLTVVGNQNVNEGSLLSLTNIGTFTDPGFNNPLNAGNASNGGETVETFTFTVNWGDGTATDSGPATVDTLGSAGVLTAGSFDGQHTYADNGVYTVTVTVFDDDSGSHQQTFQVTVANVNPTLTVVANQNVNEGSLLSLTNIGTFTDPGFNNPLNAGNASNGGETVETFTFTINWGDGTTTDSGPATVDVLGGPDVLTAGSFDGSHTYADNGVYTVTVTVFDDDSGSDQKSFQVTVANVSPTLTVVGNQNVNEGSLLSLTNIGTFTDPGFNNPLNTLDPANGGETAETFTYSINWGDGTATDSGPATVDVLGGPGVLTAGSFDGSHTYADNGVYTVTVTVFDDDTGSNQKTFQVTVQNVSPTLSVANNQNINEGALLSLTNIGTFTDPGFNNPLNTLDPANGGETAETFTFTINWGDGTSTDSGGATVDVPGSPGVLTAGSFDGQHTYADNGVYTVTVTVFDDDSGSNQKTFQVTVANVAPTLTVSANQTINEGSLLSLPNIGTFTDPGFNNPLNAGNASNGGETVETFTFTVNWGDGTSTDAGAATVDVLGSPGTLTAGSFDGEHTFADNGVYTVTVTVFDDDLGQHQQTFTVTVQNVNPTLAVVGSQTLNEGSLLTLPNIGTFTDPGFNNPLNAGNAANGGETVETFTFTINWGDGTAVDAGDATVDALGSPGVLTAGSFDGQHTFADNGTYTVTVTVFDDDSGHQQQTISVTVLNVDPTLNITNPAPVNEGQAITLTGLGVSIQDPGFDNPLNAGNVANGGETEETFTGVTIDWGDGTALTPVTTTNRVSGSPGVLTTADFVHAPHAFADNGTYTVTVKLSDDDGPVVSRTLTIVVNNVAPTVVLVPDQEIHEGSPLVLVNIAQLTDPGFDNALNAGNASNGGEVEETFTYTIDWGDAPRFQPGDDAPVVNGVPTTDVFGSQGTLTAASFDAQHTYVDNGVYTVTITIRDDDEGVTVKTFNVTVKNVSPTFEEPTFTATDLDANGVTNIAGTFADPGRDTYVLFVDWGDNNGPHVETFAVSPSAATEGVHTFTATHTYTEAPDPLHPAAPIHITVRIHDDDFPFPQSANVVVSETGESNAAERDLTNPGIGNQVFRIDTTPQVAILTFPERTATPPILVSQEGRIVANTTGGGSGSGGESRATGERYLELRVINPDGSTSRAYRLNSKVLNNLPALFRNLPDNHYAIYLVQPENNARRLVIEVFVRNGKLIDPGDDSEGARDRPPTDETKPTPELKLPADAIPEGADGANQGAAATDASPTETAQVLPSIDLENDLAPRPVSSSALVHHAALGGVALALSSAGRDWQRQLEKALSTAKPSAWKRLRTAGHRQRRKPR